MSDKILRALMQLFAIVAFTDEVGQKGREVVERFLQRQLNSMLANQYLLVFDEFLDNLKGKSVEGKIKKRVSVNSVKVLRICTDINKELEQKQKVIVLIRLLEFVNTTTDNAASEHLEFIKTVSDTFLINNFDYENCLKLANNRIAEVCETEKQFLIVDSEPDSDFGFKHISRENLQGCISFLEIDNPKFYVFTYTGTEQLFLDGRAIIPGSVNVFEHGSVIRGTKIDAIYYNEVVHNYLDLNISQNITLKVEGLEHSFNKNKIGLHEINFTTTSKNLIAIMGNSGAGKTTLMNILNGSSNPTKGKILVNNICLHENKHLIQGLIGNIPQDDLLIEELTVFQNLFYSTKLFFGGLTDEEITQKTNHCLKTLGLHEIKDLPVGDPLNKFISGGQRKRLNIALELVREPEILFVDEPTSGLSSNDAENVMDLLKQLTLSGKLIFVVIHQPSSEIFKLFDQLLLLDKGGYPVYFGNPVDSVGYFKHKMHYADFENSECSECGNINPDEIFKIIEAKTVDEFGKVTGHRKVSPEEWYQQYNETFNHHEHHINFENPHIENKVKISNPVIQFWVYLQRNVFAKINNQQYIIITLLEGPILALILSIALRSSTNEKPYTFGANINIPVYIFICTIVSLFLGLIVSADEIIQDKKILKRESFLRLSRNSYLTSKIAFLFLVSAIQSLLFLLIGNTILGFNGLFFSYWIVLFSVSCFANLLGLNISSGMKTRIAVYILIPFLVIPQIMLSGVMVKFEELGPLLRSQTKVPWIGNIMASRWAYEGLTINQFKNNEYEKKFFTYDEKIQNATYGKDFWLQEMQRQQNIANGLISRQSTNSDSITLLDAFFKYEFNRFKDDYPFVNITNVGKMNLATDKQAFTEVITKNLSGIEKQLMKVCNDATDEKNALIEKQNKELGVEQAINYKNKFYNQQLHDYVTNELTKDKIIFTDNRTVRKFKAVFYKSVSSGVFSAPMYSYSKNLFGLQIETLWFNVIIIWFMTFVLYITLYFDLLKKLLEKRRR